MASRNTSFKRTPNGVVDRSRRPVLMRLSPGEHQALDTLAAKENRSASSMARAVFRDGLEARGIKVED